MKALKFQIVENERNEVHFKGVLGSDYTLCGLNCDLMGDPSIGISAAKITNNRVNCPDCISVVEYCHKIKKTEYIS